MSHVIREIVYLVPVEGGHLALFDPVGRDIQGLLAQFASQVNAGRVATDRGQGQALVVWLIGQGMRRVAVNTVRLDSAPSPTIEPVAPHPAR